jgi:hypothetical protein
MVEDLEGMVVDLVKRWIWVIFLIHSSVAVEDHPVDLVHEALEGEDVPVPWPVMI